MNIPHCRSIDTWMLYCLETVKHDLSCSADLLVDKEFLQARIEKTIQERRRTQK